MKIGLETHITLNCENKLFCKCIHDLRSEKNTNVCAICLGEPGTLPQLNESALNLTVLASKLLNCTLADNLIFDRKHYIYPDLPKGYQITQYRKQVGHDGYLEIYDNNSLEKIKTINIKSIQLEEDPCSLDMKHKLIDYNRSGRALIEIVTLPELKSINEVICFLKTLVTKLEFANICSSKYGSPFRCDVNISTLNNPRIELKNLGSIEEITKAIEYEISRQAQVQDTEIHTRSWNEIKQITEFSRKKESDVEYAYLPEYNLGERSISYPLYDKEEDIYYRYECLLKVQNSKNKQRLWAFAHNKEIYLYFKSLDFDPKYNRLIELIYRLKTKQDIKIIIKNTQIFLKNHPFSEKNYLKFIENPEKIDENIPKISSDLPIISEKLALQTIKKHTHSDMKFEDAINKLKVNKEDRSKNYVLGLIMKFTNIEYEAAQNLLIYVINNY